MPFNRAPADIARSAAESEAPWAWRGHAFSLVATDIFGATYQSGNRDYTIIGPGNRTSISLGGLDFGVSVNEESEYTVLWHGVSHSWGGGDDRYFLYGQYSSVTNGYDFGFYVSGTTNGLFFFPVNGENVLASFTNPSAGQVVTAAARFVGSTVYIDVLTGGTKVSNSTSISGSASNSYTLKLGEQWQGTTGTPDVTTGFAGFRQRAWSDAEVDAWLYDPFAPFRRRRTFVPVTVGGADITGSGSPQAGDATAAGTGERVITGTTTVQAQSATATGTGKRVITDQSSTVQAQQATASGSGTVGDAITGSGSAQAQDATATATGEREITGQGTPQAQAATATGVGERIITGAAAVQADPANASGTDTEEAFKAKLQPGVNYARLYSYIKG